MTNRHTLPAAGVKHNAKPSAEVQPVYLLSGMLHESVTEELFAEGSLLRTISFINKIINKTYCVIDTFIP